MQITLCLYPRFSNFGLANALEPLRAANDLSGRALYRWRVVTPDGGAVASSSGLGLTPEGGLEAARGDALFLLPSYGAAAFDTARHRAALRRAATRHEIVAGLDMGAWLMAAAGLLEGRRATIHWDEFDAFGARFPEVTAAPERVVRDGARWSCGGATTAFDLVLGLIERQHGASLRLEVAGLFMHGEWRGALPAPASGEARVDAAVALMRRHLGAPMPLAEVARRCGLSIRRMEALFAAELGASPRAVYRRLRLTEARRLLEQTGLRVGEIAARCGYADPSALGRAFRAETGASPSAWRARSADASPRRET
jgi:transcriptional regulator GlxA family with amidase domain